MEYKQYRNMEDCFCEGNKLLCVLSWSKFCSVELKYFEHELDFSLEQ